MPARPFTITQLAASGLVHTGRGALLALLVCGATDANVSVTLYDNTAGSGTKLAVINLFKPYGSSVEHFYTRFGTQPGGFIPFSTGLYIAITNAEVTLWTTGATS